MIPRKQERFNVNVAKRVYFTDERVRRTDTMTSNTILNVLGSRTSGVKDLRVRTTGAFMMDDGPRTYSQGTSLNSSYDDV